MTVVCGLVDRSGRCYLAGDTQVSAGDERTSGALRKTRRAGGIVLGACGDLGPVSVVLRGRWVPQWGPDERGMAYTPEHWVRHQMTDALCRRLRGHPGDVALLLGLGGELWYLDRECCHGYPDGYAAIGTGASWALGALTVLWGPRGRPRPQTVLRRAVGAAEAHCSAVGGWGGVVSVG